MAKSILTFVCKCSLFRMGDLNFCKVCNKEVTVREDTKGITKNLLMAASDADMGIT